MSKLTTGRFETREELEEFVMTEYRDSPRNIAQICRAAGISNGTFNKIYEKQLTSNQKPR